MPSGDAVRIVFTGQSGVGVDRALTAFASNASAYTSSTREPPLIFKIEDSMKGLYLADTRLRDSKRIWIDQMLTLPHPVLYDLWRRAVEKTLASVQSNPARDCLLSLHACFYHHYTVEYLSFARLSVLANFQPDMFVTFIDDIYDIHDRLRQPNQIFHPTYGGATDPAGAIFEALRLLDWRAREIMMTRFFANELGVPHYLCAIKHSHDTLSSLLHSDKPTLYISHPIREVRRLQRDGNQELAATVINAIATLAARAAHDFTTFLPTTIDELRIDQDKSGEFLPVLLPRWDQGKYDAPAGLLYTAPRRRGRDPLWASDSESRSVAPLSSLLRTLSDQVEAQVSSRDHELVEQSDVLLVYRPCFNGDTSAGVLKEIAYYSALVKATNHRKRCFIYCPLKDQSRLKQRISEQALEAALDNRILELPEGERIALTVDEITAIIRAWSDRDELVDAITAIMDKRGVRVAVARRGLESDRAQKATDVIRKIADSCVATFDGYLRRYLEAATILWDEDGWTPDAVFDNMIGYMYHTQEG